MSWARPRLLEGKTMIGWRVWFWARKSAQAPVSACLLGMSLGLVVDGFVSGSTSTMLCADLAAPSAGALVSRIDFMARAMPFMHLGAVLGVIVRTIAARVTPVKTILAGSMMLAGMALGGALTMGLHPLSGWLGMCGGMVLADGLAGGHELRAEKQRIRANASARREPSDRSGWMSFMRIVKTPRRLHLHPWQGRLKGLLQTTRH